MRIGLAFCVLILRFIAFVSRARGSIYQDFKVNWCRQRKWRLDWENLQKPCQNLRYRKNNGEQYQAKATSPAESEIFDVQIRPAGEYSRFFVQSRTNSARRKTIGGDSWRVYLEGPSNVAGTVFDHNNGIYEVLFLIMEPGAYKINMILDYTLCDGLIDPPVDWFRSAHCSGKLKNVHLSNQLFSEMTGYINQHLQSATSKTLTIPWQRVSEMDPGADSGGKRKSKPWVSEDEFFEFFKDYTFLKNHQKQHDHVTGRGVLWIYGDSLSYYFYKSLTQPGRLVCSTVFKDCNCTYNWIYPKTLYELTETCGEMSLQVPKVLNYFRDVILRRDMDKDSALLLNAGAHYVKTTSFQSYRAVILALIEEMKTEYKGKPVWKSTTAIHGQTADIMGAFRRFTTNHRIQLYNAFANSAMCKNNISVLDVYPISDSYPPGTMDGIHYKEEAFYPFRWTEVVSSFEQKLSFVCFLTTSFSVVSVNMTSEVAFSPNDDYIVCGDCNRSCIFGDCPDHGPLEWIDDHQVPQGTQSTCRDSLPSNLCLRQMGVFARERIEKRAMFGPFRGRKIPLKEMNFEGSANIMNMWEVFEGGTVSYVIDGTDEDHSNWMRFVNCARDDKEQNLLQVQYRGEIYFKTLVPVEAGSELLVWYQDSCVKPLDGSSHQTGHDFVCDVCKLEFSGPTFLLRHKSVRCPGIAQVPYLVHQPESQDNGTSINGDSSTHSVGQTESSYVVVHLEPNANENHVTKIDTVENSPYVVVHVQPAPTTSSNNLGTGKRRKRILAGDKTANASKQPKPVNTRQRAAVNREKEAKKVASKARSTVDAVKEANKVGSKGRFTKARGKRSSKAQTVKNAAANKSLTPKRAKETKRTSTSSASRSRGGTVRKVKQNGTVQSKSAAPTESVSSSTREESGDAKKDGQRATDGNKALKKTSGRKAASKGAKTRRREIQKQYDKSKSSSSRKRRSEDMATAESDDISIEKQKQTADKTTGKENNAKASEKKGRYIPAKKQKAPVLKEKPAIKCEICRKNFKWKSQLNYHMRCHTSEKEFKCPFCNKGLSQMSSLKRHLRVHSGEKPHQCEECGKRFLEKTRLIYHLRKHRGQEPEKKYKCGFCDKRFTLNANMKTHERTHTGEKPYPCPQCGKMFRRSSDISSHLRSHTGERPYKCSHCPKAFTMISHRKRHEIIHTGERPFKCDICGKGFTQPNSVKAHLKVHARKEALAESRGDNAVQRPRESVSSNGATVQTTDEADEGESRGEIAQNSGAEQMQINNAPGLGSTAGTSAVITSTETLSSTQTKPVGTERSHQGDDDLTQVGIQHQGAASLLLLGAIPEGQTGLFNLRNTGVSETAAQSIGDHLQLSCTNAEQFTIVSSQVNAGLMPLPCIPQVGFDCENVPLQLDQSGGQNHVQVDEGEETASTLLAL